MRRASWTGVAILGAVLVQTALGYVMPRPGQLLDPFLLVVVYCALSGGETHGMLAGVAAGWVQDALFGGGVLGLSALSKLVLGFAVGLAGGRFLIVGAAARALTLFVTTILDGVFVPWLASIFAIELLPLGFAPLLVRASVNALVGGVLMALVAWRLERSR